jgi:hypothetical protein
VVGRDAQAPSLPVAGEGPLRRVTFNVSILLTIPRPRQQTFLWLRWHSLSALSTVAALVAPLSVPLSPLRESPRDRAGIIGRMRINRWPGSNRPLWSRSMNALLHVDLLNPRIAS